MRLTRGGLGLIGSEKRSLTSGVPFKIYRVLPFLDEFRVIADWTATTTSLDLFQQFKLEDVQQNLYDVLWIMSGRRMRPLGWGVLGFFCLV